MTRVASSHPHLERSSPEVSSAGSDTFVRGPERPAPNQPPFWPPPPGWKPAPTDADSVGPTVAWQPAEESPGRREWLGLGAVATLGFLIAYGVYEFLIALGPEIDCAALMLTNAHPVGGHTAGETVAPLLGLGLLTTGGFASWRWRTGGRILLLVGLGAVYIASLVVIWYALPAGPHHCVWTP